MYSHMGSLCSQETFAASGIVLHLSGLFETPLSRRRPRNMCRLAKLSGKQAGKTGIYHHTGSHVRSFATHNGSIATVATLQ